MTKSFARHALRAVALSTAIVAAPMSAQATLTLNIPTNFLEANGILSFSSDGLAGLGLVDIAITPLGNATAVPKTEGSYNLPVTSIGLQLVKISGGSATGSALEFNRLDLDTGRPSRLTLANFTINFNTKKILADATVRGKASTPQTPVFDFQEQTPLALKYKFPLSISAKQILDKLFLTQQAQALFKQGLELPEIADEVLKVVDFGTITVDVGVKLRSKPVSTRPYVAKP